MSRARGPAFSSGRGPARPGLGRVTAADGVAVVIVAERDPATGRMREVAVRRDGRREERRAPTAEDRIAASDQAVGRMVVAAAEAAGPDGPAGPARDATELSDVGVWVYCPRQGGLRRARHVIRRARGPDALAALDEDLREAARRYAAEVEAATSVRGPGDGLRGGGVSDGGAALGVERVTRMRAAMAAVGSDVVLDPRGARAHADRGRGVVTVLDVVDGVARCGGSLSSVLAAAGWSRGGAAKRRAAEALAEGLARLAVHYRLRGGLTGGPNGASVFPRCSAAPGDRKVDPGAGVSGER